MWVSHVTAVSSCLIEPLSCVKLVWCLHLDSEMSLPSQYAQSTIDWLSMLPLPRLPGLPYGGHPTEPLILTQMWLYSFLLKHSDSVCSFIQQIMAHVGQLLYDTLAPAALASRSRPQAYNFLPCPVLTAARMILLRGKLGQIPSCQISQ